MRKLYIFTTFLLLIFATIGYSQTGQNWKWQHPTPQGNTLRWVKMWDANNWYAVGYAGTFMKTTNAGANWEFNHSAMGPYLTYGQRCNVYSAYFFNQNTGIVVGTSSINSAMYKTTNAGITFDSCTMTPFYAGTIYSVYFLNNNIGYAVGNTVPKLYRTIDGGITWQGLTTAPTTTLYDVYASDTNNIIVSTTSGNVSRTTNGGLNWTAVSTGATATLYKIAFANANTGFVAGSSGSCRYTTNGGLNWTLANTGLPTTDIYYDLDLISSAGPSTKLNEGFEDATFPPTGWTSYNVLGINVWTRSTGQFHTGVASAFISYEITGGEDWLITKKVTGIAAGDSLIFWWKNNFGVAYPPDSLIIKVSTTDSLMPSFTNTVASIDASAMPDTWTRLAYSLSAFAGQNIYIAFRHLDTDGGGGYLDDVSVQGAATLNVTAYLTGNSFNVYKSSNFGVSWDTLGVTSTTNAQPWTSTYYATDVRPTGDTMLVGGSFGLINKRISASNRIVYTSILRLGQLNDIWAQSISGNMIAVGAPTSSGAVFDQIMRSTNGGTSWNLIPYSTTSTSTLQSIAMINDNTGFACGTLGAIYKTTNAGLNWDSIPAGIPTTASLIKILFVDANTGWTFSKNANNTLPDSATIFKTTNGGVNWFSQKLTGQTGSSNLIYGASFVNANTGYIINWSPKPFITTDGGATWTAQTLIDAYAGYLYDIKMLSAESGYCVGGAGRLYKTTNSGALWDTVSMPSRLQTNYVIKARAMDYFMVAGSTGTCFFTNNAGSTWYVDNNSGSTNFGGFMFNDGKSLLVGSSSYIFKNVNTPTFTGSDITAGLPNKFELAQNYPNPFNPTTTIAFAMPKAGIVTLKIYDILGREVMRLVNNQQFQAGWNKVTMDGSRLSSGVYFYTLNVSGNQIDTKRMVLVK